MDKPAVSFDVFAVSPQGFEVHFQLAGEKVYAEAAKLLEAMRKDGFTARPAPGRNAPRARQSLPQAAGAGATDTQLCPVHKVAMARHEGSEGVWYSHKLQDGSWCNGKAKP